MSNVPDYELAYLLSKIDRAQAELNGLKEALLEKLKDDGTEFKVGEAHVFDGERWINNGKEPNAKDRKILADQLERLTRMDAYSLDCPPPAELHPTIRGALFTVSRILSRLDDTVMKGETPK